MTFKIENAKISDLKPHPQNYRFHPEDQRVHLMESIKEHGVYRNVVVAKDNTILAGHGIIEAAKELGLDEFPVVRINVDPTDRQAIKILTGDNEVAHLAEVDDRVLTELLKQLVTDVDIDAIVDGGAEPMTEIPEPGDLLGTGYDPMMLATRAMISRPKSEIKSMNEAAEWAGMPEYHQVDDVKLVITFDDEEAFTQFCNSFGITILGRCGKTRSTRWPPRERRDITSVKFES
jgi:hypothetical protein